MSRQRIRQDCAQIWTMRARLYAISDEWGRSQAWDIVEAVVQALDDKGEADFVLPAPFVISENLHVTRPATWSTRSRPRACSSTSPPPSSAAPDPARTDMASMPGNRSAPTARPAAPPRSSSSSASRSRSP